MRLHLLSKAELYLISVQGALDSFLEAKSLQLVFAGSLSVAEQHFYCNV
jgi:hypothetical protein